ncbi:hypothetical protein F5Y14DRAFT_398109 [Nemania sp. NC0429]|nr:hypothetical protein F5Y14DRAFT_398109 [Nemania sp. NC0429]
MQLQTMEREFYYALTHFCVNTIVTKLGASFTFPHNYLIRGSQRVQQQRLKTIATVVLSNMDPSLKEKQAFFRQLDLCKEWDEESDTLDTVEQGLRQASKAFFAAAAPAPPISTAPKLKPPGTRHLRTTSDPVLRIEKDGLEIIAVTPRNHRVEETISSPVHSASAECIIPETERPPNKRLPRRRTHPPTRVLRSQSNLEASPSVAMPKRKRPSPLRMAPESKQIFKGLRFAYIQDNDLNPARREKMTRAREHGATWERNFAEATHVIVDDGLSYADIEPFLRKKLTPSSVVLVRQEYPIECVRRGVVFDPKQTVEKYRYGVPGDPGATEEPEVPQSSTQSSGASLQIKLPKDSRSLAEDTQHSVHTSGDLIPSSYPERIPSPKADARSTGRAAFHTTSGSCDAAPTSTSKDELDACIDEVLDDPEKFEYLDESDSDSNASEDEGPSRKKAKDKSKPKKDHARRFALGDFMCMRGGTKDMRRGGPNAETIKLLEEMAEEHYLSMDPYRVLSYRKAIATLRRQPKKITKAKEAKKLPNIGPGIADHVEEIATTGRFQKLEQIRCEPSRVAVRLFIGIHGVGVPTANNWARLGHRTLDDVRSKVKLTANQQIGLDHYEELSTRIPRAEVTALGDHVKGVAATIDPNVELIIGGSYRRGAEASGDIDIIMTKSKTSSAWDLGPFATELVSTLTESGFLTAALASRKKREGNKWQGCCVLPKAAYPGPERDYRPTWRRIDFLLVPETELGAGLLYFTGNDLFNRSMRLLAGKRNMKLNHHALTGVGVNEGRDEKKIFEALGVQWREPHERWC